ncbi:MAG: hypothetical protein KatS3mg055_3758 [Chloroflexus sp.]|uniref:DUF445 domain-containing protein n=1 Tax=Chloroflexus sp. TaxID=1904827 RepID=UPI0021DBC51C|nr:DUF445 domain-containing protein [Chloroflexus sp.]GIV91240.1 MAG: hypothetical protein KatS3mg055_3758 [Chloroflexus sp.]
MEDQQRLQDLRRMQLLATGLLVMAGMLFVVTSIWRDTMPWIPYVRAFAEAAMVGAFADWFAVTALFRHPLGIPIPHTAIIPARKTRIAVSFGRFIETNFLDPDQITERICRHDPATRLAQWLRNPKRGEQIADLAAEAVSGVLRVVNDEDVSQALANSLSRRLETIPVAPLLGRLLGVLLSGGRQRDVLMQIVSLLAEVIASNEVEIRRRIAGELPVWVPRIVDQRIYERLLEGVQRLLRELREDPDHPLYQQFTALIDRWIVNLQFDPQIQQQGEALKREVLAHPLVREWAEASWRDVKLTLLDQSVTPASPLRRSIALAVTQFADILERDPEWRAKIERWLTAAVAALVRRYRRAIGEFVTQIIHSWDTAEVTRKIELQFGRDLQFIRINGTIVGGLVGLIIYSIAQLLP